MKAMKRASYILLFGLLILTGAFLFPEAEKKETNLHEMKHHPSLTEKDPVKSVPVAQEHTQETLEEKVTRIVENMTLQEKIGQLLIVGFDSTQVNEHIQTMIEKYHVGGVILYDRNMETSKQVTSLTSELQTLSSLPLYISIDQEGGSIVRMKDHVSPIPSQQDLGKRGSEADIYSIASRTGKELLAMGIQLNFAPVLDLSETDSRSFGEDPKKAAAYGKAAVMGLSDAGVIPTLKHFPGNGRSGVDPHIEGSSVHADKTDLENSDLFPFKSMIDHVNHDEFFVMVTHLTYPAYDKQNPASISQAIMQDLLRTELGFEGMIVTDDMEMGAVSKHYSYEELGYKSIKAGADLLLVCHTLENQVKVINGIEKAIKENRLPLERLEESVKRIITHKLQYES